MPLQQFMEGVEEEPYLVYELAFEVQESPAKRTKLQHAVDLSESDEPDESHDAQPR